MAEPELMAPHEAATVLGVSVRTIERWCDRGVLDCYRDTPTSPRTLYRMSVEALLRNRRPHGTVGEVRQG